MHGPHWLPLSLAALVALASAAPAAADDPVRPAGDPRPLGTERLSDEMLVTRWAHPLYDATIREAPNTQAAHVGRVRLSTEDQLPEVYLALRSHRDPRGAVWIQTRIPGRPNGRLGWVPRSALARLQTVRTHLRVNRRTLRATLWKNGRRIWRSPIGVGKPRTPTPAGRFWIRERLKGLGGGDLYGPWAFGTGAYSVLSDWPGGGVVGIHGTNEPELIPGRPSHGCVRVPNGMIRQLARLLPIGTPVHII